MSLGNKLLKNITANYVGVAGQIVIAFLLSPFLVHTLGDTKYGIWTIVAALSGYMSLLDLGVAGALTRYVAFHYQKNEFENISSIISSGAFLFYCVAGGIVLLSPLTAWLMVSFLNFDPELVDTVFYLVIVVSFDVSFFVIGGFLRGALGGFQRFDLINLVRLFSLIYKGLAFYIFLSYGFDLIAMGIISVSANLLVLAISFYQLKKYFPFTELKTRFVNKVDISRIYHFSKFIFIAMIANQVLFYSDSFIIGFFLNMAAVTYYTIPWSLSDYVKQFCLAVSSTYIPLFSELHSADDKDAIFKHYIFGTKVILILSNLLCVGMIVMGAAFIALWMGEFYAEQAKDLIIIFFVTLYFYAPHLISYAYLQALNKHKLYSYLSVVIAILNLVLSIILVQKYGLIGVAIGTAIPQIIFFGILVPFYTAKINHWSYFSYLFNTHVILIVPTALLFSGLYFLRDLVYPQSYITLLIESILVSLVYLITIYIFSFSKDEKLKSKQMISRLLPAK